MNREVSTTATIENPLLTRIVRWAPEAGLALVVLTWASTFIVTKDAFNDFRPMAFIFARFAGIVVVASGVLLVRGWHQRARYWAIRREHIPRFLASGVLGYSVYQIGFTQGLAHSSPFTTSLIIALVPLISLLIVTTLGERSPSHVWIGVSVAVVGAAVFLVDRDVSSSPFGVAMSFGAAISFAAYGITMRPLVRAYPAETVACYTTVVGAIPLLLVSLPSAAMQDWSVMASPRVILMIAYMVIVPIYIAYIVWNWVISRRGVGATSATLLVPIVAGLLSSIVFSEPFGALKLTGAALVLGGLVLMRRPIRRRPAPTPV